MPIHRKKTYEALKEVRDALIDSPGKQGESMYVPEKFFELSMKLIDDQREVISKQSAKIKNLRKELSGINKSHMSIISRLQQMTLKYSELLEIFKGKR